MIPMWFTGGFSSTPTATFIKGTATLKSWPGGNGTIGGALVAVGDHIYRYSGATPTSAVNTFYRYTISTNTWTNLTSTTLGTRPPTGTYIGGVAINSKLYVIGVNNTGLSCYDIPTNTWTTCAPCPFAWSYRAICSIGGKIYTVNGNNMYMYTPETNTWSVDGVVGTSIVISSGGAIGSKFYFYDYTSSHLYAYDTTSRTTTDSGRTPFTFLYSSASVVNDVLYIAYGIDNATGKRTTDLQAFDPGSQTWTTINTRISTGRSHMATTGINGNMYCYGGVGPDYLAEFVEIK